MRQYIKDENGLTLIEILAAIIIGSIVLLLISNAHLFGQKQYKSQSEKSRHLYDVTYAAKVITKEIRKADEKNISNIDSKTEHIKLSGNIEYKYNSLEKTIENKDGTILIKDISKFYAERLGFEVKLEIISVTGEEIKTTIVLRRGD